MNRVWAFLLVLAISFSLFAPALAAETRTRVPACCRKDAKKHCDMGTAAHSSSEGVRASSQTLLAARSCCPMCPLNQALPAPLIFAAVPPVRVLSGISFSEPQSLAQTEARQRFAISRSVYKRGPPTC